jgi:hypothetical protein
MYSCLICVAGAETAEDPVFEKVDNSQRPFFHSVNDSDSLEFNYSPPFTTPSQIRGEGTGPMQGQFSFPPHGHGMYNSPQAYSRPR